MPTFWAGRVSGRWCNGRAGTGGRGRGGCGRHGRGGVIVLVRQRGAFDTELLIVLVAVPSVREQRATQRHELPLKRARGRPYLFLKPLILAIR
jgi:hypothetical protein